MKDETFKRVMDFKALTPLNAVSEATFAYRRGRAHVDPQEREALLEEVVQEELRRAKDSKGSSRRFRDDYDGFVGYYASPFGMGSSPSRAELDRLEALQSLLSAQGTLLAVKDPSLYEEYRTAPRHPFFLVKEEDLPFDEVPFVFFLGILVALFTCIMVVISQSNALVGIPLAILAAFAVFASGIFLQEKVSLLRSLGRHREVYAAIWQARRELAEALPKSPLASLYEEWKSGDEATKQAALTVWGEIMQEEKESYVEVAMRRALREEEARLQERDRMEEEASRLRFKVKGPIGEEGRSASSGPQDEVRRPAAS